jgi:histone H3/H4
MAKKKGGGGPALVVQSKVRDVVRKAKMKCASDVIDEMNRVIQAAIARGVERAKSNGRKTLRGADL